MKDEDKTREQLVTELKEMCHRITELEELEVTRKRTEEALRESENRFRTLFQNAPVGIGLASHDGHILDGNEAIIEMFGYSKKELEEIRLRDVYVDPIERSLLFEKFRTQGYIRNYEVRLRRKDDTHFDANLTVIPFTHHGENVHLTVIEDISDELVKNLVENV